MKYIKLLLKKIIISILFIYALDLILVNISIIIPINIASIFFTTLFGIPGIISYYLLLLKFTR